MPPFVIRSSAEILPKVRQPQAVHWASYDFVRLVLHDLHRGFVAVRAKSGRISIAPPSASIGPFSGFGGHQIKRNISAALFHSRGQN
jgi:hypothetical protein